MPITLSGQNDNTGIAMGTGAPLQNATGNLVPGQINPVLGAATTTPNNLNTGWWHRWNRWLCSTSTSSKYRCYC